MRKRDIRDFGGHVFFVPQTVRGTKGTAPYKGVPYVPVPQRRGRTGKTQRVRKPAKPDMLRSLIRFKWGQNIEVLNRAITS